MLFDFYFVKMILDDKLCLHPWDKFYLVIVCNSFLYNAKLIFWYLVVDFCGPYFIRGIGLSFSFLIMSL